MYLLDVYNGEVVVNIVNLIESRMSREMGLLGMPWGIILTALTKAERPTTVPGVLDCISGVS